MTKVGEEIYLFDFIPNSNISGDFLIFQSNFYYPYSFTKFIYQKTIHSMKIIKS